MVLPMLACGALVRATDDAERVESVLQRVEFSWVLAYLLAIRHAFFTSANLK